MKLRSQTAFVPRLDKRDIDGSSTSAGAKVEGTGRPEQSDPVCRVVGVEGNVRHEWLNLS